MVSFSPPRVKIADFGISKEVLEDGSLLSTEVGAKGYMAPEVTLRPFPMAYDTAVDIWSLGCVIYIILTHEHLFPPVHSFTLEAYSQDETLLALKLQRFSPAVVQFIAKLTRVEPSERLTAQKALKDRWLADPLSGKALAVQNARPGQSNIASTTFLISRELKKAMDRFQGGATTTAWSHSRSSHPGTAMERAAGGRGW